MRFQIDASELQNEAVLASRLTLRFKDLAVEQVSLKSVSLMKKIKSIMPIDTGRARAGWGKWTLGDIVYMSQSNKPTVTDPIWMIEDDGLSIVQGTDVPYVTSLNEGSSTQAPTAFIDVAAEQAGDELENGLTYARI